VVPESYVNTLVSATMVLLVTIIVMGMLVLLLMVVRCDACRRFIGRLEPTSGSRMVTPRVACRKSPLELINSGGAHAVVKPGKGAQALSRCRYMGASLVASVPTHLLVSPSNRVSTAYAVNVFEHAFIDKHLRNANVGALINVSQIRRFAIDT
jgi:hypothetical protein